MSIGPTIVTEGLNLSIDPADPNCYVTGSSFAYNLADPNESGSFNNLANTFWSLTGSFWYTDSLTDRGGNSGNFIAFGVDDDTQGDATNAITYECWTNRQGLSSDSNPRVMSTDLSDYCGLYFPSNAGATNLRWIINIGGSNKTRNSVGYSSGFPIGEWFHFVGTADYNGSNSYNSYLYINGELHSSTIGGSASGNWGDGTSRPFAVSSNVEATVQNNRGYNAFFGPVRVYSRLLTADEVKQNYNAQKSRFGR